MATRTTPFLVNETSSAMLYQARAALAARIVELQPPAPAPTPAPPTPPTPPPPPPPAPLPPPTPPSQYGLTVADNKNTSMHGFARVVTVTSPGQFRISFSGTLQGCGDHIVDLVNDPSARNPLNPDHRGVEIQEAQVNLMCGEPAWRVSWTTPHTMVTSMPTWEHRFPVNNTHI